MSIVIIGDLFSFPEGKAATNRVYTYGKGFLELGMEVHIICMSNNYMENHNGTTEGLHYYNPFGEKSRNRWFLKRRWFKLRKYFRIWRILKNIHKQDKILVITRYSDIVFSQFFVWLLSRYFRTKVITECSEHPFRSYQGGWYKKFLGNLFFRTDVFFSDSIFCISRYLIDFHRERGVSEKRLFLVPSTVDPSRMENPGERPLTEFYIGYFGGLTFYRDNVDLLLKAFSLIQPAEQKVKLVLGGFCSEKQQEAIHQLIKELNISSNVTLLPFLGRSEIVNYIANADILVMVRARDLESDASYPSKLTEYLATGKPVISVNVGEITDHIKDGEAAYLVPPGNEMELARKIDYVIKHYQEATEVGVNGKKLASGIFHYRYQADRMHNYILSLQKRSA